MMTTMKRSGVLLLALVLSLALLLGCTAEVAIKQNPDGSYQVGVNADGSTGSVPKLNAEGTETTLPQADMDQLTKTLNIYFVADASFDTDQGVPDTIVAVPLEDAIDGPSAETGKDGLPILSKEKGEAVLSEFWGRTISNIHDKLGDEHPVMLRDNVFVIGQIAVPLTRHESTITKVYDLGNGYYKITGTTDRLESPEAEAYTKVKTQNMTVIVKKNADSIYGYSLLGQKYE